MKSPKMKTPVAEKVTPLPDPAGAQSMQARFDSMKSQLSRRGRSSTLMTYAKPRSAGAASLSGRLSDVDGGRVGTTVGRM